MRTFYVQASAPWRWNLIRPIGDHLIQHFVPASEVEITISSDELRRRANEAPSARNREWAAVGRPRHLAAGGPIRESASTARAASDIDPSRQNEMSRYVGGSQ